MYRALNLDAGDMVAVKMIGLEGLKEEEIGRVMREVDRCLGMRIRGASYLSAFLLLYAPACVLLRISLGTY